MTCRAAADKRLAALQTAGYKKAQLYGRDAKVYGGLNAFFLLMDEPEVYKLRTPQNATLPSRNNLAGYAGGFVTAVVGLVAGVLAFPLAADEREDRCHPLNTSPRRRTGNGGSSPTSSSAASRRLVRDRHAAPARRTPDDQRAARIAFIASFLALLPCRCSSSPTLASRSASSTCCWTRARGLSFKPWSPMSLGSWALLGFGLFSSCRSSARGRGRMARRRSIARILRGTVGAVWNVIGTALGLFVCGYTGVLLAVSNQPVWSDGWPLGGVFLASSLTGAAALLLLLAGRGATSMRHCGPARAGRPELVILEVVSSRCSS